MVKRMAIQKHSEYLDNESEMGYSKLKDMRHEKARMKFQMRTKMLDFKVHYKNDKNYKAEKWKCEACGRETETQVQ